MATVTASTTTQTSAESAVDDDPGKYASIAAASCVAVMMFVCIGICTVRRYRKRRYIEALLNTTDQQFVWTANQMGTATTIDKEQVILPMCDIKTTAVERDTRIYPMENQWLVSEDHSGPAYCTLGNDTHEEEEEDQGTITNIGYEENDDFIHSIFQRLHNHTMGNIYNYNRKSDSSAKSIENSDSGADKSNADVLSRINAHDDHNVSHNTEFDDDISLRLQASAARRVSADETYSHLNDCWIEKHQSNRFTNKENKLSNDANTTLESEESEEINK